MEEKQVFQDDHFTEDVQEQICDEYALEEYQNDQSNQMNTFKFINKNENKYKFKKKLVLLLLSLLVAFVVSEEKCCEESTIEGEIK